jgi:hypothetical protein
MGIAALAQVVTTNGKEETIIEHHVHCVEHKLLGQEMQRQFKGA